MGAKGLPKGITQRPDGRYMARFQYKGEKYCLYDYNIERLQERMSDLKYEVRHGVYAKEGNVTVDEWFKIWIDEYKKNVVKEATLFRYESVYNKHIKNVLGDKKLRDTRPEHIQKLYNGLKGTETVVIAATILSGMFEQAYNLQQQAQALADSTFISENQTKILDIQRDFELFKSENEKRLYQYQTEVSRLEISRKNISIVFVSLCLLVACGIAIFLYAKFRKQKSRSHELNRLMEQNSSQDRQLMQSLKNETDKKTRELASATLSMAKINEVLSETLTGIEQVRRTTRDSKSSALLLQIESKLRSLDYDERQWENFKLYFEQIHPLFFSRLSKAFPALTTGELRLCAFIVMNMTSKEIASVTNRSIRTIDSIKFRLRSKMSIPKETSTLAFLLAFTNDES